MNRLTTRLPVPIRKTRPPSRLAALLDFVIRHAGAVPVEPTDMVLLDQISPRTAPHRPARPLRRV